MPDRIDTYINHIKLLLIPLTLCLEISCAYLFLPIEW